MSEIDEQIRITGRSRTRIWGRRVPRCPGIQVEDYRHALRPVFGGGCSAWGSTSVGGLIIPLDLLSCLPRLVSEDRVTITIGPDELIPGRRAARARIIAAGLSDDDIDRLLDKRKGKSSRVLDEGRPRHECLDQRGAYP